ncbi:MAG: antiterminator LoaP [Spirochaetaceae bacterium]
MNKQNYYVLLVESGKEVNIRNEIECLLDNQITVLLPTRELYIKKNGHTKLKTCPMFNGYLFLEVKYITPELLYKIKTIKGFYKFLNSNKDIIPLREQDVELLGNFLTGGYKATVSTVFFNKNDKIVVKDGPLKEFEGKIIKVDKRKKRAKVQLSIYNKSHTIDFSFQDLESNV